MFRMTKEYDNTAGALTTRNLARLFYVIISAIVEGGFGVENSEGFLTEKILDLPLPGVG